jgi:hypothetical protein
MAFVRILNTLLRDKKIGKYVVKIGTNVLRSIPLVAETDVPKAGFVKIMVHSVLYFLGRVKVVTYVLLGIVVLVLAFIIINSLSRMRRQKSRVRY